MRAAYAPVPPVPDRRWHLLGPAVGAALVVTAGVLADESRALPAPVVAPPTMLLSSVVEILAIGAIAASLLLTWRRPVHASVLQAVAAVILVTVASIEPWGVAGPAVALLLALGLHTAQKARTQALGTWPRTSTARLDAAERRAVDDSTRTPTSVSVVVRVLGAALIVVGLAWTGVDVARVHAFRTDPATVTTEGTVLDLLEDDLYATLDVDSTHVVVEILTAPPAIGDVLPVRFNSARNRAELLGTPFDPVGALFWTALGITVLVAMRHRSRDMHALAGAARGLGTPLTLNRDGEELLLVSPAGTPVARLDALTLLRDPDRPVEDSDAHVNPEAAAEADALIARLETLSERPAAELDDHELLELFRAETRLEELSEALDPALEQIIDDGARTAVVATVVPSTGDVVLHGEGVLLRSTVLAPHGRTRRTKDSAGVKHPWTPAPASQPEPAARTAGLLIALSRWIGDRDALPMLAVHAAVAGAVWWMLDEPDNGWWAALRIAVVPAYLLHLTWRVQPSIAVRRTHLLTRERLRVTRTPWSEVTGINVHDGTAIVRTLTDGTSDAIVIPADPGLAVVPVAGCRTPGDIAARLRDAWVTGRTVPAGGARTTPSLSLLLGCAWAVLLVATVLVP